MDTKVSPTLQSWANFFFFVFLVLHFEAIISSFLTASKILPAVKETTRSLLTLQLSTFAVQLSPLLSQVGAHTDSMGGRLKPAQKVKGLPTGSGQRSTKGNNKKAQIWRGAEESKLTLTWRATASPSVVSSWKKMQQTRCRCWRMRVGPMALWRSGCSSHPSTPSGEPAWPIKQQVSDISAQITLQFYNRCTATKCTSAEWDTSLSFFRFGVIRV